MVKFCSRLNVKLECLVVQATPVRFLHQISNASSSHIKGGALRGKASAELWRLGNSCGIFRAGPMPWTNIRGNFHEGNLLFRTLTGLREGRVSLLQAGEIVFYRMLSMAFKGVAKWGRWCRPNCANALSGDMQCWTTKCGHWDHMCAT